MENMSICQLPNKLKNSMKGLINIKNNYNKCFLLCHIRHLNPLQRNSHYKEKQIKNG